MNINEGLTTADCSHPRVVYVDKEVLKPCCVLLRSLLLSRYAVSCEVIILCKVLDSVGNSDIGEYE